MKLAKHQSLFVYKNSGRMSAFIQNPVIIVIIYILLWLEKKYHGTASSRVGETSSLNTVT